MSLPQRFRDIALVVLGLIGAFLAPVMAQIGKVFRAAGEKDFMASTARKVLDGFIAFVLLSIGMLLTQAASYNLLGQETLAAWAGTLFWLQFLVGGSFSAIYLYYRYGRN